ncbi:hypothetical protein ACS0TY_025121 [Phlomoides rotata]
MKVPKKRRSSLSSSSTKSSAVIIGGNDDLLIQILVLLPAKSLVRFKSVSTHWQFLISGRSFSRLHLLNHDRRRPEPHSFILGVRGRSQFFICDPNVKKLARFPLPLNFLFLYYENVKILQSCNGLLLIRSSTYDGSSTEYSVVNPTTVKSRSIFGSHDLFQPDALCLIFDPSKSPYYRVVAFWKGRSGRIRGIIDRFSVYNSATRKWKRGGEFPDEYPGVECPHGVSCNDRAYFLRKSNPSLSYSPEEKLMRTVPCPPEREAKKYVVESNGHLHCLNLSFKVKRNMPCFEIAEMIDNQWSTWKRDGIYTIDGRDHVELLGMIRAEMIEDSIFLFHVPGKIMIYRFDEGCEVLVDYTSEYFYEEGHFQFEFQDAHPFVPTFASV